MDSPITYYGGKKMMANQIVSIFPEHRVYCEPFFGGGAVFFTKQPSYLEVINDKNDRLITFYLQLQNNPDKLIQAIKNTPHSESLSKLAREIYNKRIEYDDLGMAWAVWMMTNGNFTGSPHGGWKWCNGPSGSHTGIVLAHKKNRLSRQLFKRIEHAQISSRDALRVIDDRDTPVTLYFLDPPYPGADQKHYAGYSFRDLEQLLIRLTTIKGKFILTNYPSQMLRYYCAKYGWEARPYISRAMMFAVDGENNNKQKKTELIVTNFVQPLYEQGKIEFY